MPSLVPPLPNCSCRSWGAAAPGKAADCHCLPQPKEPPQAPRGAQRRARHRPPPPAQTQTPAQGSPHWSGKSRRRSRPPQER
eukprot:7824089-Alexandrium_andersonii.AAC.1